MRELSTIAGHYGEKALSDEVAKRLNDMVSVYQPDLATPELKNKFISDPLVKTGTANDRDYSGRVIK